MKELKPKKVLKESRNDVSQEEESNFWEGVGELI
jgi:hypothetical protein